MSALYRTPPYWTNDMFGITDCDLELKVKKGLFERHRIDMNL